MIEIWGRKNSSNVAPVMWAIAELDLPHKRHNTGGSFGGLDEAFAKINPNRKIPAIRDGELYLWESNAIVRYLAYRYGTGKLAPAAADQCALADQWMDWCKTTLWPAFFPIFWQNIRVPAQDCDHDLLRRSVEETGQTLEILNHHLAYNDYVAGDDFSMGDLPFGSILYRYFNIDIERRSHANIDKWYKKLCQRPAYQQHVMIPFGKNLQQWNELERAQD